MENVPVLDSNYTDVGGSIESARFYPLDAQINGVYNQGENVLIAKHGDDSSLAVKFYKRKIINRYETRKQGKEISTIEEWVSLRGPGQLGTEVHHKVNPYLINRFHTQYQRFKSGKDQLIGTPIIGWDIPNDEQKQLLVGMQIRTIEQLANVSDSIRQDLGPNLEYLVKLAREYVEKNRPAAAPLVDAMAEKLEADNKKLLEMNQNLLARLERLENDETTKKLLTQNEALIEANKSLASKVESLENDSKKKPNTNRRNT